MIKCEVLVIIAVIIMVALGFFIGVLVMKMDEPAKLIDCKVTDVAPKDLAGCLIAYPEMRKDFEKCMRIAFRESNGDFDEEEFQKVLNSIYKMIMWEI